MSEPGAGPEAGADRSEVEPGGAGASRPARPLPLAILLVLIAAMNLATLVQGVARRDELMRDIPRLSLAFFAVWMVASAAAVAGAAGLWFLRRVGFYLIGLAWAMVIVVDLRVGATSHLIFATGLMWLMVIFVRPVRDALR